MRFFVSVSGGKDSTALLLWAKNNLPNDRIVPFFADTGNEHELTYQYIDYLQDKLGFEIARLRAVIPTTKAEKYGMTEQEFRQLPLMLQQALHKGRFASSQARFCTTDLKLEPAKAFINQFEGQKVMLVGVRRDESAARANAKRMEFDEFYQCPIWRPLVEWTADDVFNYLKEHDVEPNPLYKMGFKRVGCFPCIMANKDEIYEIAQQFPEHIDRIREWEKMVGRTFFAPLKKGRINWIDDVVAWSGGNNGFIEFPELPKCKSHYAICE
jgi:3'-phosphoadenosine 5'-phosphosulfate sulfotransferase (PAPS reductase)/FAD synthetase